MNASRWKQFGVLVFPAFLSLLFYQRAFRIWFLNDDFAWLGLGLSVQDWPSLLEALFAPMAQGTVRTLSERAFFLVFERSFGWESLPMRIFSFATLAAAQVLLALVVQRLTGLWWVGMLSAVLWSLNFGLTVAFSWLSSFNQILLSLLALGTLYGFLRWRDGAGRRWWLFSWFCYLLAFGALETAVVIPAILLSYTLLLDRSSWRSTLPYWVPAIAFALLHLFVIEKPAGIDTYRMYFDSSLFESLWLYWTWFLGAAKLPDFDPAYAPQAAFAQWSLSLGVFTFLGWRLWRRDGLVLFLVSVSALLLAPVLPLREHRTDYYLASASLGLVALLAFMPARLPVRWRWPAWALIGVYAIASFTAQQATIEWYLGRTGPLRPMMRGLLRASQLHPDKLILLEGISPEMQASSIADGALRLIPGGRTYLAPGYGNASLPVSDARKAFEQGKVVVYRFEGTRLRDVTREWESGPALALASAEN